MRFPFSAVVAQPQLLLALRLLAVDPQLGGVLIQGEKGTAKTTAVRGLAELLPHGRAADAADETRVEPPNEPGPFVELPLNATEDRVVGSIDVERLVESGEAVLDPGLIAAAHGGVLYVDEVNLLADHLVDVLLDAAASGRLTVERDGVSASAPAEFALVGTMNPEEGELRPQLLDRFGLSVAVRAPRDPDQRVEVVTRRLDFESDPAAFRRRFADSESAAAAGIQAARAALDGVETPRRELRRIALVCLECEVQGMRADVVTARAAVAHAALAGRSEVTEADVRAVASFVLPHRRRRDPFDPTGMSEAEIDAAFDAAARRLDDDPEPEDDDAARPDRNDDTDADVAAAESAEPGDDDGDDGDPDPGPGGGPPPAPEPPPSPDDGSGSAPQRTEPEPPASASAEDTPADASSSADAQSSGGATGFALAGVDLAAAEGARPTVLRLSGRGRGARGRRSTAYTASGRAVPAPRPDDGAHLDVPATVRAAARSGAANGAPGLELSVSDLRYSRRLGRSGDLVAFLVDTSGSMAARRRLELVARSAVAVLRDAYVRRDLVGVVTAGGHGAVTALAPTRSVDLAVQALTSAPTGGRTPLAEGLEQLAALIHAHRLREPERRAIALVLTDGRATAGAAARERALAAARRLGGLAGVAPVVVDCEQGRVRLGGAAQLAKEMRAPCLPLAGLTAGGVTELARAL